MTDDGMHAVTCALRDLLWAAHQLINCVVPSEVLHDRLDALADEVERAHTESAALSAAGVCRAETCREWWPDSTTTRRWAEQGFRLLDSRACDR